MWLQRSAGTPSTSGRCCSLQQSTTGRPTRRAVRAHAAAGRPSQGGKQQPAISNRNAQLYELCGDDGWGVEVAPASSSSSSSSSAGPAVSPPQAKSAAKQKAAAQQPAKPAAKRRKGTPYVDMRSEEGIFGMTLLQKALLEEEEQQAADSEPQQQQQPGISGVQALKQNVAQTAAAGKGRQKPKLPGFPKGAAGAAAAAAALAAAKQQRQQGYDDEYEDEEEDTPEFQLVFDNGKAELIDFSTGTSRSIPEAAAGAAQSEATPVWMLDEQQFEEAEEGEEEEEGYEAYSQPAAAAARSRRQGRSRAADDEEEEDLDASLIADMGNEDDWGLDGLLPGSSSSSAARQQQRRGRRSLLDELEDEEAAADGFEEGSLAASNSTSVQWGGSAGFTGIDLEEQEDMLRRYFKPQEVQKLMKDQKEIEASLSELRKRAVGLGVSDHKMQQTLRIVAGTAAGKKLVSFRGSQTRPMMEKVRQAIFNMIQNQAGTVNCLPKTARWLDLFAGTGSVGIEALSRGVKEAHFVEMDPVVVNKILSRNLSYCGFKTRATCHTTKAEEFLRRAASLPRFAGGAFDFISVCPPYLLVSYPELFDLLEASPLLHAGSIVFVEYPKQLAHQVRDSIGPLQRIKDRKYGRTYVAVYAGGSGEAEEQLEEDPFLSGRF
uniref:Uncharacterized protein n=1 Tax=Tetradesmus obliquus TaxID=3088 RepID=A0A383VWY2_TETOB|eukprot:jgi/Sobl393_1/13451/SZX69995.1